MAHLHKLGTALHTPDTCSGLQLFDFETLALPAMGSFMRALVLASSGRPCQFKLALLQKSFDNARISQVYGAGCIGYKKGCGMIFSVRLPNPVEEATFSYKVKFSDGYDWTFGGKLPGLCSEGVHPVDLAVAAVAVCYMTNTRPEFQHF